jgi:uroporphyrinogen III methyltransferase / synthase
MSFKGAEPRTVVVTRAEHQAGGLSEALRAKGMRVIELPTIRVAEPEDWGPFDRALASIRDYRAVLIGSKNVADAVKARGFSIPIPICTVGAKTKAELQKLSGLFTGEIFSAEVQRAEGMVDAIAARFDPIAGERFLFLRAPEGRETAIDLLEARGAKVDAIAAYRIAAAAPASDGMIAALETADVFTFMSGETLACFFEVVPEAKARALLANAEVAVIGPVARARAEGLGVRVDRMPAEPTVEALVSLLAEG